MKIHDLNSLPKNIQQGSTMDTHAGEIQHGRIFQRHVTDVKQEQYEKKVSQMLEDIQEQGQKVAEKADIKEMQKYRSMISELLQETVSNSYAFKKENAFDTLGRHRVYALINKVNEKLDGMTQEVLQEESDNIALLDAVDDIRGLLVDLML